MGKTMDLHTASFTFMMDHNGYTLTLRSTEVKHREGSDIAHTAIWSLNLRKYNDNFSKVKKGNAIPVTGRKGP
jgi:hypothetical protein